MVVDPSLKLVNKIGKRMEMETDKHLGQMGHAPCEEHGFLCYWFEESEKL